MRAQFWISYEPTARSSIVTLNRTCQVSPGCILPSATPSGVGSSSGNAVPEPSSGIDDQPLPRFFSVVFRT